MSPAVRTAQRMAGRACAVSLPASPSQAMPPATRTTAAQAGAESCSPSSAGAARATRRGGKAPGDRVDDREVAVDVGLHQAEVVGGMQDAAAEQDGPDFAGAGVP